MVIIHKSTRSGALRVVPARNGHERGVVLGSGAGTLCLSVEVPGSVVSLRERGRLLGGIPLTPQHRLHSVCTHTRTPVTEDFPADGRKRSP